MHATSSRIRHVIVAALLALPGAASPALAAPIDLEKLGSFHEGDFNNNERSEGYNAEAFTDGDVTTYGILSGPAPDTYDPINAYTFRYSFTDTDGVDIDTLSLFITGRDPGIITTRVFTTAGFLQFTDPLRGESPSDFVTYSVDDTVTHIHFLAPEGGSYTVTEVVATDGEAPVPEPTTLAMIGIAAFVFTMRRRERRTS